jgi:hypothetical protein
VAAVPDRLSRAMAFNAFKPLDRHGFADLVPAHLMRRLDFGTLLLFTRR